MGRAAAAQRLEMALAERERMAEQHAQAAAPGAELVALARLQAANLRVTMCRRSLQIATAGRAGQPA